MPFLIDTAGIDGGAEALPDPHAYLRDLRAFLNRRRGDGVLLGEVNLSHQDARAFFGDEDGDEVTLLFDFPTMQACWLAMARADAGPIRSALGARLPAPADSQWAVFLRNHDELTLDKLSGAERAEVFAAFGPEPDMQLYGRGLRRRLPPMLDGDQRRIRLAYSLMFGLPGTPALFYGEEIGMGEQLALEGRMAVRTPMQWQPGPGGGFSHADEPCRPVPGRRLRPGRGQRRRPSGTTPTRCSSGCGSGSIGTASAPSSPGARPPCSSTTSRRCSRCAATGRAGRSCRRTISGMRPPRSRSRSRASRRAHG